MRTHIKKLIGLTLLLSLFPGVALAQTSKRYVIFGDSLSDPGNFFADTGEVVKPPFMPIPDAPYTMGGHHFSNGETWIEQMATWTNANPSADPAVVNPKKFSNYAFGRARARSGAPIFSSYDLSTQVQMFLSDFDNAAPADATYVIWIGTNDARDSFSLGGDPMIIAESLMAIAGNISLLIQHGARDFVVLNIADLGLIPAINSLPAPIPALATGFTQIYNANLSAALDLVEPAILGLGGSLVRVDTFGILQTIVADPTAAGLVNVTDSYLEFGTNSAFMQPSPSTYLFWDGGHPTRAGHAALGRAVAEVLTLP